MKRADGLRSAPDRVFIETTSIHPQSSGFVPALSPRSWPPDSRAKIERLFLKAFRYRWNRSSETGSPEGFLQTRRSWPSIVCVLGSRLASRVYSTTGGEAGVAARSGEAGRQLVKTAATSQAARFEPLTFSQRGREVSSMPLTPALSRRERENISRSSLNAEIAEE